MTVNEIDYDDELGQTSFFVMSDVARIVIAHLKTVDIFGIISYTRNGVSEVTATAKPEVIIAALKHLDPVAPPKTPSPDPKPSLYNRDSKL